jgi:hypothetical protein
MHECIVGFNENIVFDGTIRIDCWFLIAQRDEFHHSDQFMFVPMFVHFTYNQGISELMPLWPQAPNMKNIQYAGSRIFFKLLFFSIFFPYIQHHHN